MDVSKTTGAERPPLRRFFTREFFCGAESQGEALVYSLLSFAVALLFSRTHAVFGAYPFALAYLAAADRRLPFAFAGACIGALTLGARGYVYCLSYLILTCIRLLLSQPRENGKILPPCYDFFEEEPPLRAASACVSGCFLAIYQLIAGGLAFESVLFAAAILVLPVAGCVLYIGFFSSGRTPADLFTEAPGARFDPGTRADWIYAAGVGALGFSLLLGAGDSSLFGISLSLLLGIFFCMFFPIRWGVIRGGAIGFLVSLGTLTPIWYPACAVTVLSAGLLYRVGLFYALAAACVGGTLAAYLTVGMSAILDFMPEAIVGVAVAWPLFRDLPRLSAMAEERRKREAAAVCDAVSDGAGIARMQALAHACSSLSEVFRRLSETAARPKEEEYRAACERVFDRHCAGCAGENGCWAAGDKNAERALACLSEQYARGTSPADIRLPDSLMRSCGRFPRIREEIRDACAALEEGKRKSEKNGVLAEHYAMTAEILNDAAAHEQAVRREDAALGRACAGIFSACGVSARQVSVFGAREKTIVASGVKWDANDDREAVLRERLEEAARCRLGPAVFETRGGVMCMKIPSVRRLAIRTHEAGTARGREVSGDAFSTFEGQDDRAYALLSDGMGSGRDAAITAGIVGAFLGQALAAGISKSVAIRALNTVLCERGGECSATVDLFEIDLLYGRACFLKSGAAASYVKRGDNLYRIRSSTAPIGILHALDAEKIRFDVQAGDVVVMLSDGISQSPDDAAWLCDLLTNGWDGDGDAMADKILNGAREHAERGDDMTVAIIEIEEAA